LKIARALFVGSYRISHTCLSLQFDHYLKNIDQTYIFTNYSPDGLDTVLKKYNIDTSNFIYVEDREMNRRYPTINNWWFDDDPRGSWLYQQALKIASIDYIDADVVLIQDPDTFCIKPYECLVDGKPKFFVLPNETHSPGYYKVIENSLGIKRQTKHCFVTEFIPTFKEDWLNLKHTLETRNNCDCFDAMINNVPLEDGLRWFSEYEYLGNWTMTQRHVNMTEQKRFEYKTLDELDNLTGDYNCVCDVIPKLSDSLLFDYYTGIVTNFDVVFDKVKKFI
jgi:hypothetical protein